MQKNWFNGETCRGMKALAAALRPELEDPDLTRPVPPTTLPTPPAKGPPTGDIIEGPPIVPIV